MAPAPTDADDGNSGARNPELEQERHPKPGGMTSARGRGAPPAPAAPVPVKGRAAAAAAILREDTSSVGSRGAPSPPIANGSGQSSSVQPQYHQEEEEEGKHQPPAAGPGNLSSGISIEELKKMTALRMANQQQQAHLRVVSPFSCEEGAKPVRPHSRGPSPNQPHAPRDREISGESSGGIDGGGGGGGVNHHHRRSSFPRTSPTARASPPSNNGPLGEGGGRPDDDIPAAFAAPPAPSSTCSGHSSRSGGDGGGPATLKLGGRPISLKSNSSSGGGRRRKSPPPPAAAAAPSRGGGGSSRTSPVSTTSVMAHGLTVQELKELTKIRLAREAFDIPVHSSAAPPVPGQQDLTGVGSGAPPRGETASPALSMEVGGERRHRQQDGSRSPMHLRSNPSSPGLEDRPHRRTRRGGRRGRNRSPRPGDQYSPRLGGDEDDPNGGYSSASYSPRPRRSMSDPWADPHDQYPRSSSQPRTVSRDDHPLLSAISRDGSSGDAHDGGARLIHPAAAADSDDPGDAGVKRDRGEGTGSLGSGGGVAGLGGQGHPWSTQAAQSLLSSSQSPAFSSRSPDDGSIGGQSGGGRSSPPMGDMVWDNEFRRGDGAGGVGRGSLDGAAESFQHHHGGDSSSRGRDRDRDTRAERGMGTLSSGQRPRSLHHLDRRQFAEAERRHFPAEAEQVHLRERGGGGMPPVHGMMGHEPRLTSLRGFEDPRTGPPPPLHHHNHDQRHQNHHHHQQHRQHHQPSPYFLRTQRSNSEGLLRPGPQQHQRQQPQQHNYLRVGSSTGNVSNNSRLPLRAPQDAPRLGDRHHSHHYQQQQQQVQPHRRYGSDSSHQHHHPASHGGYPGASGAGGGGGSGSWTASGGTRYFPPQGGPGGPQLVSRKSDGGGVVISSAAYHPQGIQGGGRGGGAGKGSGSDSGGVSGGTGIAGAGGVRHGSSSSLAEGDISYNVAESVLVTPRTAAGGGSWKSSSSGSSGSGNNNNNNAHFLAPAPAPAPSWREYQAGRAQQQQQQQQQERSQPARHFAPDGRSSSETVGGGSGGRIAGLPDYPSHNYGINSSGARATGGSFDSSAPSSRRRRSHEEDGMMPIMSNHHHGTSNNGHHTGPFPTARGISSSGGGGGGGSAHASPALSAHRHSPAMGGARGFQVGGGGGSAPNVFRRGSQSPPAAALSFSPAFGGIRGNDDDGSGIAVGGRGGGSDAGTGGGDRGSPLSGGSPLMAGLSFSLDLAGYTGGGGGGGDGGGRLVGRAGSEGALSAYRNTLDFSPTARNGGGGGGGGSSNNGGAGGASASTGGGDGGRGFASGLFGFDAGSGGGGGMGASPSSHRSAGAIDAPAMPRQLDIGPSSFSGGGALGRADPPLLGDASSLFSSFGQGGSGGAGGGGGVDATPFRGSRQTRSASSPSIPIGGERIGGAIAAIGSSRNNSAHSSPVLSGVSGNPRNNGNGNRNAGTSPEGGMDSDLGFSVLNVGGGGGVGLDAFSAPNTVQS